MNKFMPSKEEYYNLITFRLKKSIIHYDRLIDYIEREDPTDAVDEGLIKNKINQGWHSSSCSLCDMFVYPSSPYICRMCPLGIVYGLCGDISKRNNWLRMNKSINWQQWIKEAKKMRRQLKVVLKLVEKEESRGCNNLLNRE